MPRRRTVELLSATMLSQWVRSLVFRCVDGAPLGFVPGQYVDLFAKTETGLYFKRPYSIASAPSQPAPDAFEIAVSLVEDGPMSTALHAMPIGARGEIEGPAGSFTMRGAAADSALFIATGTGLAPLRSMLAVDLAQGRQARGDEPRGDRLLLFGCRTERDILWGDELHAWAKAGPRFRLEVSLSRAAPHWKGRTGYVQEHTRELALSLGGAPHAYVCGLSMMTDAVVRILEDDAGFKRDHIHYETYD